VQGLPSATLGARVVAGEQDSPASCLGLVQPADRSEHQPFPLSGSDDHGAHNNKRGISADYRLPAIIRWLSCTPRYAVKRGPWYRPTAAGVWSLVTAGGAPPGRTIPPRVYLDSVAGEG
jgi:hypothetical protein